MTDIERDKSKMRLWEVTRYIVEYFEVRAETKKEAMVNPTNPYKVTIIKETCKETQGLS